jgi:streptolysin S family bacteriocin protoxin
MRVLREVLKINIRKVKKSEEDVLADVLNKQCQVVVFPGCCCCVLQYSVLALSPGGDFRNTKRVCQSERRIAFGTVQNEQC